MKAVKIAAAVLGLVIMFLGLVFLIGGRRIVGTIMIGIGTFLLVMGIRRPATRDVVIRKELEISGDVSLESMKCSMCGASLSSENVTEKAGAVFVECPYCHGEYQIEETPKW